jgi:hypothetical protein
VWSDPAMMMPAGTALVHDVDLTVVVPESTVLPWTLNPQQPINGAMRMENHVDNVEQVTIEIFDGGAEAVLVADLPMASEQEVVVHWYYAPCENEDDGDDIGGDGTGGSDDGDGGAGCAGCSTSSPKPRAVPLWTIFMLLALRRRTRAPGLPPRCRDCPPGGRGSSRRASSRPIHDSGIRPARGVARDPRGSRRVRDRSAPDRGLGRTWAPAVEPIARGRAVQRSLLPEEPARVLPLAPR